MKIWGGALGSGVWGLAPLMPPHESFTLQCAAAAQASTAVYWTSRWLSTMERCGGARGDNTLLSSARWSRASERPRRAAKKAALKAAAAPPATVQWETQRFPAPAPRLLNKLRTDRRAGADIAEGRRPLRCVDDGGAGVALSHSREHRERAAHLLSSSSRPQV